MSVPYLACMLAVASAQHLPARVLPAIHAIEGGAVGTVHVDRDGSEDLGVMQINTRWVPVVARRIGRGDATVRQALIGNPCFNIVIASAILRVYLRETNGNLLLAIGDYHSHTKVLNQSYQAAVIGAAVALFGTAPARR